MCRGWSVVNATSVPHPHLESLQQVQVLWVVVDGDARHVCARRHLERHPRATSGVAAIADGVWVAVVGKRERRPSSGLQCRGGYDGHSVVYGWLGCNASRAC